jgi:hypothetical protein
LPVQPRTPKQVAARAIFSNLAAQWRGLTTAQMAAWKNFANSFTVVNSLGQTINLTGTQAFVKVNCVNNLLGRATVLIPPALPAFIALTVTALAAAAGTPAMTLTGTTPAAGTTFMLYSSGQISPGVSYNNQWKFIGACPTFSSTANILAQFEAVFGAPIAGKKVMVKVVQEQLGMQDNGTVYSAIIAA